MSDLFKQLGNVNSQNQNQNQAKMQNSQLQNQQQFDMNKAFQQFKQNPVEYLIKAKFNIPDNVPTNPSSIGQYLLQSGQINQNQIAHAMRMMGMK